LNHSKPEIVTQALDGQNHLVQIPYIASAWLPSSKAVGIVGPLHNWTNPCVPLCFQPNGTNRNSPVTVVKTWIQGVEVKRWQASSGMTG